MFGSWKDKVTIHGSKLEIHHLITDKKKLIMTKGRIELKEFDQSLDVDLEGSLLIIKLPATEDLIVKDIFKWIEKITAT